MKPAQIIRKLESCRKAARELRAVSTDKKDEILREVARQITQNSEKIIKENEKDLKALSKSTTSAFRDRLLLNEKRLAQMTESLEQVAALEDPVGEVVEKKTLDNGLEVTKVRSPLGVILMIFESRPNVASEAFSLAFKAGNVIILRGGKEAMRTTQVLYDIIHSALKKEGLNPDCVWGITDPDRAISQFLLKQKAWIDIVVPRGGDGLIEFVVKNSHIPIIKNDRGLCHVYVHEDADVEMALEIVANAKCQRPGVCNAMETLLVHQSKANELLPKLYEKFEPLNVEWFVDPKARRIIKGKKVKPAKNDNWDTEYLDLKMNCKIVDSLEEAIEHIEKHGSRHSEAIVTRSEPAARRFQSEIDAAAVYWNTSTRFTDGFELGLGGELGISTQKLHVRGPVGLRELTSPRWIVQGSGQVRK